jgi:ATP-dependent Lon protease
MSKNVEKSDAISDLEAKKKTCEDEISEAEELAQKSKSTFDEIDSSLELAKKEAKAMVLDASKVFDAAQKVFDTVKAKSKEHTTPLTEKHDVAKTEKAKYKKHLSALNKKLKVIKRDLTAAKKTTTKTEKAEEKTTHKDMSNPGEGSVSENAKPVDADEANNAPESDSPHSVVKNSIPIFLGEAVGDIATDTVKTVQAK